MKKKISVIIVCIVVAIFVSTIVYIGVGTTHAKNLMNNYLAEKGYRQNEIQSIHVSHSFLNIVLSYQEWSITVVYTDEPTSTYYYTINGNVISEGGVSGSTEKENLKH